MVLNHQAAQGRRDKITSDSGPDSGAYGARSLRTYAARVQTTMLDPQGEQPETEEAFVVRMKAARACDL